MKTLLPFLMLSLLATAAAGADKVEWAGKSDCLVANTTGERWVSVTWNGACSGGYAAGTGTLDIKDGKLELLHYEGELQRGLMHGTGYLRRIGYIQYEGGFERGEYHGSGTLLTSAGRYDGEWKQGKRDGKGKMVYTVGGQYDGQWKGGRFHGVGKVRYVSGRELTAEFVDGVRVGQQPIPQPEGKHSISTERGDSRIPHKIIDRGSVSFSESYAEMSAQDQATVRSWFPLLDDGDEPPYPLNGTKAMYQAISKAVSVTEARGMLHMYVDIDERGVPSKAAVYATPDPEFSRVVMNIVMQMKFKPAMCAGKPCAMKFPVSANVSVAD